MKGGGGVGAGGRVNELPKFASSCVFYLASFQLELLVNALIYICIYIYIHTRVSRMGLAPQPVSSVRKKPTNPWFMPLGGPVEPQAESEASLLSTSRGSGSGIYRS